MVLNKFCAYRVTHVNVLPAILYTSLYSVNAHCPAFTRAQWISWGVKQMDDARDVDSKIPYPKAGFRLSFKFLTYHVGIEVLHEPRRTA